MMNTYFCEPCMKFFTGIRPYESHLASIKHKKKVNEPICIAQDLKTSNVNANNSVKDPFIISLEKGYKCALCKTSLNSEDQVKCHINGTKHLREKARTELSSNSNTLSHNQSTDTKDKFSSSSAQVNDSRFQLHLPDAKELLENTKLFKPDDEIVLNTAKAFVNDR